MARAMGGDVMVRLLGEVVEFRSELRRAREDVRTLSVCLGSVIANVAILKVALDGMRSNMDRMSLHLDAAQKRLDALEGKH